MPKLVRIAEAADMLRVKTGTLRQWQRKRQNLDFVRVGSAICVTQESLDQFIERNTMRHTHRSQTAV